MVNLFHLAFQQPDIECNETAPSTANVPVQTSSTSNIWSIMEAEDFQLQIEKPDEIQPSSLTKSINKSNQGPSTPNDGQSLSFHLTPQEYSAHMDSVVQLDPTSHLGHSEDIAKICPRYSWTSPERKVAYNAFRNHLRAGVLPSSAECKRVLSVSKYLQKRSIQQLKSWLSNEIKSKKKEGKSTNLKTKKRWSSEAVKIVYHIFADNFKSGKLPTLLKCQEIIETNPILRDKKPASLKAFINNRMVREKRLAQRRQLVSQIRGS